MTGLTENQRGIVQMLATVAMLIAATQIPPDLPYRNGVVLAFGILSILGMGLQKFLQADPAQQQTVIDSLKAAGPALQKFAAMPPDQQKAILALLEPEAPVLLAPQPVKVS